MTHFPFNFAWGPGILWLRLVRCKTWFYLFLAPEDSCLGNWKFHAFARTSSSSSNSEGDYPNSNGTEYQNDFHCSCLPWKHLYLQLDKKTRIYASHIESLCRHFMHFLSSWIRFKRKKKILEYCSLFLRKWKSRNSLLKLAFMKSFSSWIKWESKVFFA